MIRWEFTLTDVDTSTTISIDEPQGVADMILNINRDDEKHGIFFENSLNELTFRGKAATFLQERYDLKRVDANVQIDISLFCEPDLSGLTTEPEIISAKIDFKTFKANCGNECMVTTGLEQTGCINLLQSRMDTKIDLSNANDLAGVELPTTPFIDYILPLAARELFLINRAIMTDDDFDRVGDVGVIEDLAASPDWFDNVTPQGMLAHLFPAFPNVVDAGLGEFQTYAVPTIINGGFANRPEPDVMPATMIFSQPSGIDCTFEDVELRFRLSGTVNQTGPGVFTTMTIKIFTFAPGGDPTDAADYVAVYDEELRADFTGTTGDLAFEVEDVVALTGITEGVELWFSIFMTVGDSESVSSFIFTQDADNYLQIQSLIACNGSEHKVSLIHESLCRVVQSITEQCMPHVVSNFYGRIGSTFAATETDGCGSLRVITNGLKLRRALIDSHFISFRELYDWLNAMDNIGMSIEMDGPNEVVRIEDVKYFYDNANEIFELTNIPDVVNALNAKKVYSKIKVGYDNWETNFTSGLDEINSNREYRTEAKFINNELNIVSGFVAGSYAIEQARRESFALTGKADTKYDNNTFIICVVRDGEQFAAEYAIVDAANMLPGYLTAVNARISPVRNLLRWHKSIVNAYAHPETSDKIVFAAGTGNYVAQIETTRILCTLEIDNYGLGENETTQYNIFETSFLGYNDGAATKEWQPFIQPEIVSFEYPMSVKMYKQVKANPYGYVSYSCGVDGDLKKGYIKSIRYSPVEGIAQFELIPEFTFA